MMVSMKTEKCYVTGKWCNIKKKKFKGQKRTFKCRINDENSKRRMDKTGVDTATVHNTKMQ